MGFLPTNRTDTLSVQIGRVGGGTMTAGSADLVVGWTPLPGETSAVGFSAGDVGRIVTVLGAGPSGGILIAHVATYINSGHVTLDVSASTAVDGGSANTTIFRPVTGSTSKIAKDSVSHDANLSNGETAEFTVISLDGSFVPVAGQPVLITSTDSSVGDAEGALFGGYIATVAKTTYPGTNPQVDSDCQCVSWDVLLQKRVMSDATYTGHTAGYIAADLCAKMTGDCVGCNAVAGPTVVSITFSALTTYSDALNQLRDQINTGTDTYYWYTDAWRVVHFALQTTTSAPWGIDATVTGGAAACLAGVTATETLEKYCNHGYAQASKELLDPVLEAGSTTYPELMGDGSKREFSTTQAIELLPQITVNGTSKTVGIYNVDTGKQFYYTPGSSQIYQDASEAVLSHTDWVSVRYQYGQQRIEFFQNDSGVNERMAVTGGTGYYETVVQVDTPVSQTDAQAIAQSVAMRYGVVPQTADIDTYKPGLKIGQLIALNLPKIRAVGNFLIASTSMTTENGVPKWRVSAVDGALIGDWRTALRDALNKQPSGMSSVAPSTSSTAAPSAPDVAGFTASVQYSTLGGYPYYQFYGTITLPSDCTDLYELQVVMSSSSGPLVVWYSNGPFTGGAVISWASVNYPQPTSGPSLVFTPTVVPLNSDLVPTVSAYTASNLTVPNGTAPGGTTTPVQQPVSVSLAEASGARVVALTDRTTSTTLVATIKDPVTPSGGYVAGTFFHVQVSTDGTSYGEVGVFPADRVHTDGSGNYVTTVNIPNMLVYPAAQNYYVRAWAANQTYDPGPVAAVASSAYSLAGLGLPSSALLSTLTVPSGASGSWPYNAVRPDDGSQYFAIPSVSYTDTSGMVSDKYGFFVRITATDLDATGTPCGPEQPFFGEVIDGTTHTSDPLMGDYGTQGVGYTRTAPIAAVRLKAYICNRINQTSQSFADSTSAVLQCTADITVATGGALPAGKIDPRRFDPTHLHVSLAQDPSTGNLAVNSSDTSNLVLNGSFANKLTGWNSSAGVTWAIGNGQVAGDPGIKFAPVAGNDSYINEAAYHACNPGDQWFAQAIIAGYAGSTGNAYVEIVFYDATGTRVGSPAIGSYVAAGTGYHPSKLTATVPAGAVQLQAWVECYPFTSGNWFIANVLLRPQPSTGGGTQPDGNGGVSVKITGPMFTDISGALNVGISPDFVVSGGQITQNAVNLAKAYGFDTGIFGGGGGSSALTINALGVNKLIAGTALFAGTATFAYTATGPYVQVGSAGAVFADNYTTPTVTVTIASGGFVVAKMGTSYNVQCNASGVQINGPSCSVKAVSTGIVITGPSGTLTADSSGIKIANGSSSVTVAAGGVAIVNGTLTNSSGGTSISVDTTNQFYIQNGSGTAQMLVNSAAGGYYGALKIGASAVPTGVPATVAIMPATTTIAGAGGSATLPANPTGFLLHVVNGVNRWVPYY